MTTRDAGKQRFGVASLPMALRELARDYDCDVTLEVAPRPDVASRLWWTLTWHYRTPIDQVPAEERLEGQSLDVLLRRLAEKLNALDAASTDWLAPLPPETAEQEQGA